ncbi:hypothetical protein [Eleftheria terrae]|uniref:hypothetical protein n=1 Tax=Eleftheria terrae TaxID=1597781 RepID=UPI00263B2D69|nr:hypothetical protein [Eleftheria terrae]WKB53873.1 hypothetical protein N7L95_05665 [Eleftheria terrae]
MSHVLVGVFEDGAEARQTREDLIRSGFAEDAIRLLDSRTGAADADRSDTEAPGHAVAETVGDIFRSLFGHSEHGDLYSDAVERGSLVLTVRADTERACGIALDILHRRQAVDIHVRNEQRAPRRAAGAGEPGRAHDLDERVVGDIPVLGEAPADGSPLPPPGTGRAGMQAMGRKPAGR